MQLVPQRVHRPPEAGVTVGSELPVLRQALERLLLPDGGVVAEIVEDRGLQHEEAAIDPAAVAPRLLLEMPDHIVADIERTKPGRRLDRGNRRVPAVGTMKIAQCT